MYSVQRKHLFHSKNLIFSLNEVSSSTYLTNIAKITICLTKSVKAEALRIKAALGVKISSLDMLLFCYQFLVCLSIQYYRFLIEIINFIQSKNHIKKAILKTVIIKKNVWQFYRSYINGILIVHT